MKTLAVITAVLCLGLAAHFEVAVYAENDNSNGNGNKIDILDACDPADPGWTPTGGCFLKNGTVPVSEFNALLFSSLGGGPGGGILIGHPAWRNDPSYVVARAGKSITVENKGGRTHSFTHVASFGGGVVPPLNGGLAIAPECTSMVPMPSGDKAAIAGLAPGVHHFQCCIHPWMRATIRVQ